jgi:Plavaka transposase
MLGWLWCCYRHHGAFNVRGSPLQVHWQPNSLFQPFTEYFPRADIHELLTPDLLHQVIKGTFKDHLVTWVVDYIKMNHTAAQSSKILADIDRRLVAVLANREHC